MSNKKSQKVKSKTVNNKTKIQKKKLPDNEKKLQNAMGFIEGQTIEMEEKAKEWITLISYSAGSLFNFDYFELDFITPSQCSFCKEEMNCTLGIQVDPLYGRHRMLIYPHAIELYHRGDRWRLEKVIYHELAHIHTHKLKQLALDRYVREEEIEQEHEKLTEAIARYVYHIAEMPVRD